MRIRQNALLPRRAIAIFAFLAMLVAPLCASLCGSRVCGSLASTQSGDCHSALSAADGVVHTGLAAIRVCGFQEFSTAALNETYNSPDGVKKDSALHASSNFAPSQYTQLSVSGTSYSYSRAGDERCIASTSVQTTVLRI